ncbi:MAG: penicillin acylase family protein, partial [Holophagales bacterium]|nr:penicillin acylase family protein [Holophagales bacterium]
LWGPWTWTVSREVLFSVHGPALRTPHGLYAVRFSGFGEVRQIEQWYRMNKARDRSEWRAAMDLLAVPMFHTIYADAEGSIGYVYNARLPVREPGWDWRGYLPGDTARTLWTEYLPASRLPRVEDPESGFVQNCNSSPFRTTTGAGNPDPAAFADTHGIQTRMTNRALRALELLAADPSLELEELWAVKFDTAYHPESPLARMAARARSLLTDSADAADREIRRALEAFDLEADLDDPRFALPAMAFAGFTLDRDLGSEIPPDSELLRAVRSTAAHLRQRFGGLELPWGQINRLRRGEVDLPLAGGPDLLHAIYGELDGDGRWRGVAGDSYILLAAWDAAGAVRSWSLHPYGSATLDSSSPHYADRAHAFARREPQPVWLDEEEIRRHLEAEYRPGEPRP